MSYEAVLVELLHSENIATATYFILNIVIIYVVVKSQSRTDFDFAEMLKSGGKPSSVRLAFIIALVTSTWVIMQLTLQETSRPPGRDSILMDAFALYLASWSGSKVLEKAIDAWQGARQQNGSAPLNYQQIQQQNIGAVPAGAQDDFPPTVPMDNRR